MATSASRKRSRSPLDDARSTYRSNRKSRRVDYGLPEQLRDDVKQPTEGRVLKLENGYKKLKKRLHKRKTAHGDIEKKLGFATRRSSQESSRLDQSHRRLVGKYNDIADVVEGQQTKLQKVVQAVDSVSSRQLEAARGRGASEE
ncbi:hypothetical protein EK21DRAFT_84033 [Setomelanomma holmii]|uniref:Uncharacterized protein n=1 Tax=Setomelanomma holmii TaxID=210430 RepID=A0A9P4HKQ6_9PLEO|nr:hypothetical protein EK21DRAFT_84033 [Setomelanomma holmii]